MEVKIGVQHAPREIVLESGESAEEVERAVSEALAYKSQLLSLVDEHGRKVLVPADRLAYVELGEAGSAQGGLRRAVGRQTKRGPATGGRRAPLRAAGGIPLSRFPFSTYGARGAPGGGLHSAGHGYDGLRP